MRDMKLQHSWKMQEKKMQLSVAAVENMGNSALFDVSDGISDVTLIVIRMKWFSWLSVTWIYCLYVGYQLLVSEYLWWKSNKYI